DCEDLATPGGAKPFGCSPHVRLHAVVRRLLDMRHVLEVVAALGGTGRAPEVVERDCGVAPLGEAQGELLVEAVKAPDIVKYHAADAARLMGRRRKRREAIAVGSLEHEVLVRPRGSRDAWDRRRRISVVAHAAPYSFVHSSAGASAGYPRGWAGRSSP